MTSKTSRTHSNMEPKTDATDSPTARARSESPTSKCPICLSLIDNPAFTDICIHQFCYTCLCEWAKVKAVCPVCKQEFQTIAYNVQSYEKFDELPVKNLIVEDTYARFQTNHTGFQFNAILSHGISQIHRHPQDARFRYRTTMTSDYRDVLRRLEEQRITEELRNPLVRVTVSHRPFVFSSNARKAVYRTGLRVQHLQTATEQVFSIINPQFFNDNPACKIRLSPWLQRELDVMAELSDVPVIGDTMLLINLIFTLLNKLKITSQNFYNKLHPYLRRYTLHFLQELYCFARSAPHTMPQYDSCVVYGDGTSGAIWSVWHRDKARSNSSISTAITDTIREDLIEIPSERGFISFVMKKHRRNANQSPAASVQGTSGTRAEPQGPIDLAHQPSDHNSDVEVVAQEPPWDARRPIVISDSEEEISDREQRAGSMVDRELKYPVSRDPAEHEDERTSRDPSPINDVSCVNEYRFHLSELSDENEMQELLHNIQKRKRENRSADGTRDVSISDLSVEDNASNRLKTKSHQHSSDDCENHYEGDSQNHRNKLKNKHRESQTSHSREGRSRHSTDQRKYIEQSYKDHSTSTERRKQYKHHRSRERSKSYRKRHSEEEHGRHRRSRTKEIVRSSRSLAKERSKVHLLGCSKEHDDRYSRRLNREGRERQSGDHRRPGCSSEVLGHSLKKLDECFEERQPLQCTKRKRRNSGLTYRCDSSETDEHRLSLNRANIDKYVCISSAFSSQGSSISIPDYSSTNRYTANCKPSLTEEGLEGDRELSVRTDVDSYARSYNETDSDIFRSIVSRNDSNDVSKVATENGNLNDASFDRKTYFWSDEENGSDDVLSSSAKTLKSQIGCLLFTGDCGASSVFESPSELIIELSDCSPGNQHCLPKDYDANEASCSHKGTKRKHGSRTFTVSKNSHKDCEQETKCVRRDASTKEGSCSRESQQSQKHRSQKQTSSKKDKNERQDVDIDSRSKIKMTNRIRNQMDVGLGIGRFDEIAAQYNVSDDSGGDDDGISQDISLGISDEVTFKKHFTGHKNSHARN